MKIHRMSVFVMLLAACAATVVTPFRGYAQTPPKSETPTTTRKIIPVPRDNTNTNKLNIEAWFDKPCGAAYAQGEKIMINFRTNADGYVTVYDIDTRGQVIVMFPNPNFPDNFVRANQTYTMPNPSYTYDLIVQGPEGIEYVDFVASPDPYYHWDYKQGEPRWVDEWGLKGSQERDLKRLSSADSQKSAEFRNRPAQLSETGQQSILENFAKSKQIREQITRKIVARPRDNQGEGDYATKTCYFYVVAGQSDVPSRPQPQSYPSRGDYLRRQQQDFQRIPGFDAVVAQDRLNVRIPVTILFDFDKYDLRYEARSSLDQVADIFMRYPDTSVTVAGHTDSIGDEEYNLRLSEYRAQSVVNYLISRGVQPTRLSAVGYGKRYPLLPNTTDANRRLNRRVELTIMLNPQYGR